MTKLLMRNWGIYLLNGLVAILYGILALFVPAEMTTNLAWYAGLVILLFGVLLLFVVFNRMKKDFPYVWLLIQSTIYIAIGTFILLYTNDTIRYFVLAIGGLAILSGILQLIVLVNIDPVFKSKNIMLMNALVSLAFGVIMLFNPFAVAKALVIASGIMALFFGTMLIWFAFGLRSVLKKIASTENQQSTINQA